MLIPVQQTPIPLDPARQQLTPPPPPEPPVPPRPADIPVQAGETSQDCFDSNSGAGNGGGQSAAQEQQQAASMERLRMAYARLIELQQAAGQALQSGNAGWAKEVALEAAGVVDFIRDTANALPVCNLGAIAVAADQLATHPLPQLGTASPHGEEPAIDLAAALDTARAGLGAAKDVMDTASALPHHLLPDRIQIEGLRRQVLDAMAGVEAIAAKATETFPKPVSPPVGGVDIRA